MRKFNIIKGLVLGSALFACTDLKIKELDSVVIKSETGAFTGVDPAGALSAAYGDLRGFGDQANLYALNEIASDELLVPTRGTDWGDNGVWRTLHQHTWDVTHTMVRDTWNNLNGNVYRLGQLLDAATLAKGRTASQTAQAKFLRAYNMFLILDLYRQIPQRGVNEGSEVNPQVLSTQAAIDFIAKDLTEALPDLPVVAPGGDTKSANTAAANFLQAKLFLNKHVYLATTAAAADMDKVISSVNAIKAAGFDIADGSTADKYFGIFTQAVDTETLLWTDTGVGNRIWCGLHYNQPSPDNSGGGWNGFSSYADFYAKFEGTSTDPINPNALGNNQEARRGYVPVTRGTVRDCDPNTAGVQPCANFGFGFLVGQQYKDDGTAIKDRAGSPLIFAKDWPGLAGNNERTGIRILKYHPDNGGFTSHEILFRYADAHLMKAEAILRGGTPTGETAQQLFDELRVKRGASTTIVASLTTMLDERARELYIEGWRRNDQVRFGTFNTPYGLKTNTETFRSVYPIPAVAVSSNPNLKQNAGY